MQFKLEKNINLAELTTFKIGGIAKYFTKVTDPTQLVEIFEWLKKQNLPYFILSGGSNTIFDDGLFDGLVIKINFTGFKIIKEDNKSATIWIAAGEDWDKTVARVVKMGLSGIEPLSAIPGLAGTAPVQNIGAYGVEIKDVLDYLEAFDTKSLKSVKLSNSECEFGYRNSIFKSKKKGQYIITAIILTLSKQKPKIPEYDDVKQYFVNKNIAKPSLKQIREAIIKIRENKFANPTKVPNAGSFFKNPIISSDKAKKLIQKNPDVKVFKLDDCSYKVFAGWLIENAGLKGKQLNHVQVDPKHALVLENKGGASQKDLLELVNKIQRAVKNKFGITLELEPEIVKFN